MMKIICCGLCIMVANLVVGQSAGSDGILVKTIKPVVREVELIGRYPAEVLPFRRAVLAAELPSTVSDVLVDDFEAVKFEQSLVRLDTRSLELGIQRAEAEFAMQSRHLERAKGLITKKAITDAQFLETATRYRVAEVALKQLKLDLTKSTLIAPWPGAIESVHVEVGDYVNPGQPMVTLADHHRLKIHAAVPASDAGAMAVGLSCRLIVQHQSVSLEGTIERIAPVLDVDSRTLIVEMVTDSLDHKIRPGVVAQLDVKKAALKDQLCIPFGAAIESEGRQVVYRVRGGVAERVEVVLGAVFGDLVAVDSGLTVTDEVVIGGQQWLSDGQTVRLSKDVVQ